MNSKEKLYGVRFKDRKEAGEDLAQKLRSYKGEGALVLGIPRGGVVLAYYIARELEAELSVLVAKKLADPNHPEYAIGAMAEEEEIYIDPELSFNRDLLQTISTDIRSEIQRRVQLYRHGTPLAEHAQQNGDPCGRRCGYRCHVGSCAGDM